MYSPKDLLWLSQFDELPLDREQKAVILLGQDQRVFSAQDIWEAVGIVDTEHYRKLVDSLMKSGLLRNRVERDHAKRLAGKRKMPFKEFPRYGIDLPNAPQGESRAPTADPSPTTAELFEDEPQQEGRRLFVGNLPFTVDRDALMDVMTAYGEVLEMYLPSRSGRSKGFGFIEFDTADAALAALNASGGVSFEDRKLVLRPAVGEKPRNNTERK